MRKFNYKKCINALMALIIAGSSISCIPVGVNAAENNFIINSTFDNGVSDWGLYKESGGKAQLTTEDGKLALKVESPGTLNYAVQAFYDIIPLYKNGVYHISYEISSTTDRYIETMIQQNGGTYQAYTWKGLDLNSEPRKVDYTFTMEDESDIMAKLVFNCGYQEVELPEHTIYIDNVVLEVVDDSEVDYSAFRAYEPPIVTNQIGYKTDGKKTAVFRNIENQTEFEVVNADTEKVVYTGQLSEGVYNTSADETDYSGDFSEITEAGKYYIRCEGLDNSYTFEIGDKIYNNLLDDTVKMLYLQRCGTEIKDDVFGHEACHDTEAVILGTTQKIDVSGGWHDAGDYGRYVVAAAKAVADLLYAYDASPELYSDNIGIPESGNDVPDILDEVRYELEWMLKMQSETGGVYHKVTCATFPGYVMPENETKELIVTPVSSTATADFCASMAMAYEFYYDTDKDFADKCLSAAEKAWAFLEEHPEFIFKNPEEITTGEYGDKSDLDERYWAGMQMYRATGDAKYSDAVSGRLSSGLDWSTVGDYGNIAYLTMKDADTSSELYTKIKNSVISRAGSFATVTENSPYGVGISKFNWGSNMTVSNAGVILGLAYQLSGDERYLETAQANLSYLVGNNPNGVCYVTGYGTVSPLTPHHRPSMAQGQAMKGMLVGGVNSNLEDSAAKAYLAGMPTAKCYVDNAESYSTNEITIYWNSPLTYLISLTENKASEPVEPPVTEETTTSETTDISTDTSTDTDISITTGDIADTETTTTTEVTVTSEITETSVSTDNTVTSADDKDIILGDVTLDGMVDIRDITMFNQYTVKTVKFNEQQIKNADTDRDGIVDIKDLGQLKKYIIKIIDKF